MRRAMLLLIPLALALAATASAQDKQWDGVRDRGGIFTMGPRMLFQRFLGDATPEQRESLKALGKEFIEGARLSLPEVRAEAKALLAQIRAALSEDAQAKVKAVFAQLRSLSIPEKIGLAQKLIGELNTAEMRADIRLFLKGSPEERAPAGDRIARAVAAKLVAEVAKRAEIGEEASGAVLKAFGDFLDKTRTQRVALRDLAQQKLAAAWALLTPEQKERVKGVLRFVRGWLEATQP